MSWGQGGTVRCEVRVLSRCRLTVCGPFASGGRSPPNSSASGRSPRVPPRPRPGSTTSPDRLQVGSLLGLLRHSASIGVAGYKRQKGRGRPPATVLGDLPSGLAAARLNRSGATYTPPGSLVVRTSLKRDGQRFAVNDRHSVGPVPLRELPLELWRTTRAVGQSAASGLRPW